MGAQTVVLQIRPRVGDTLHLRYDQRVEMTGTGWGDTAATTMVNTLLVFSRTVPTDTDVSGTDVVAITDSVASAPESAELAEMMLKGKPLRLWIARDGATSLAPSDSAGVSPELRAAFAGIPAILPSGRVKVGRSWTRDVVLPGSGSAGTLRATFRLDSLTRSGDSAFVSLRGTLRHRVVNTDVGTGSGGGTASMSGVVTGAMVVDRRRGWVSDSRATFTVNSVVSPPKGGARGAAPVRVRMTITEWMRTTDR